MARNTVVIAVEEKMYNLIKGVWKEENLTPTAIYKVAGTSNYIVMWENIAWYSTAFANCMIDVLDSKDKPGYNHRMLIVEENGVVHDYGTDEGFEIFNELCAYTDFELPKYSVDITKEIKVNAFILAVDEKIYENILNITSIETFEKRSAMYKTKDGYIIEWLNITQELVQSIISKLWDYYYTEELSYKYIIVDRDNNSKISGNPTGLHTFAKLTTNTEILIPDDCKKF